MCIIWRWILLYFAGVRFAVGLLPWMNMNLKTASFALTMTIASTLALGSAVADGLIEGSVEAGKARAVTCGACHGVDGNSVNPVWPSLAGQHATYIVGQLGAFKNGKRKDVLMNAQAIALSNDDMANLAAYFSEQDAAPRAVEDAGLVDRGQAIYRGGNKRRGTPACMACHGPSGSGNPAASYPSLSGQHAAYTAKQLRDYASGTRKSDGATKVMRTISATLTEDDILAISSYIQGLR